jgi:periodic tryptophan protein 1
MAWMDLDPSGAREKANMVAIGSMEPGIEIWDLDLIDQVEPAATLGGVDAAAAEGEGPGGEGLSREEKRKARKKAAKQKLKRRAAPPALRAGSHEGAVLGLAWNGAYRNVLASGGADGAVKVWDVAAQRCEHTLLHHSGKVQAVAWNPAEAPVLLTGSFDRTACIVDVRAPGGGSGGGGGGKGKGGGGGAVPTWKVSADVEALAWAPHAPTVFLVSSEDGVVAAYDARGGAGGWRAQGGEGALGRGVAWRPPRVALFLGGGGGGARGARGGGAGAQPAFCGLQACETPAARRQTILARAPSPAPG